MAKQFAELNKQTLDDTYTFIRQYILFPRHQTLLTSRDYQLF